MKTNGIILNAQGNADVMKMDSIDLPSPGAGEVMLEQTCIGLNYMDVYLSLIHI